MPELPRRDDEGPEPEPEPEPELCRVPPPGPPYQVQVETPDAPPPQAPAPGWSVWETVPVVLFMLLLTALSLLPGPEPKATPATIRAVLLLQLFFYAVLMAYMHYVVRLKHGIEFWKGLGWHRVNPGVFLTSGLGLAVAVQLLSLPESKPLPIERLFQTPQGAMMLAAFGTAVAPLMEEIIFRGFIFGAIERAWGLGSAVWATAILFAMVHVPQLRGGTPQILAIFGVGLMLSWTRARTRSLAASYFMHLGYNSTLFLMFFVATSGFREMG
jgi:hypothetical protein